MANDTGLFLHEPPASRAGGALSLPFDNSYAHLPERFYARLAPRPVAQPRLIKLNTALAAELGLDADRIAAELDAGTHRPRVERDLASAAASGATGTPTFFVNGARFSGAYDASSLVEALEAGTASP